jgi:hypothetical protein
MPHRLAALRHPSYDMTSLSEAAGEIKHLAAK